MASKTCPACGKEFGSDKSEAYLAKRTYCCVSCWAKQPRKTPTTFTCKHCGKDFQRHVRPSEAKVNTYEFCSPSCRNKGRSNPQVPCLFCGTLFAPIKHNGAGKPPKQYCSRKCFSKSRIGKSSTNKHPDEIYNYIKDHYTNDDLSDIAKHLGLTVSSVRNIAYKHGLKRSNDARQIQYNNVRIYMTANNPMKRPDVVAKVSDYWKAHPEEYQRTQVKLNEAKARISRDKPTKLELRLCDYLSQLGIQYEHQAVIKDKFIVDIRIGNLIIEADGDWWHGHSRFAPLNERQIAQQKRDASRNKYLAACGYIVIRIWESDMSKELVEQLLKTNGLL